MITDDNIQYTSIKRIVLLWSRI